MVIFKAPPEPHDYATFGQMKIAIPPPPPVPPAMSGGGARNALEPDVVVTPPSAAVTAITSNNMHFTVNAQTLPAPNLPSASIPQGTSLEETGSSGADYGTGSLFGSSTDRGGNSFTGYFYDLKQTPARASTGMNQSKEQIALRKFFSEGWNEDDFARQFLKSPKPLFANELMVPLVPSRLGPKAYGLEDICQPGYWCAIYHLKVSVGQNGDFRVAGYGDDFLVVRVNGAVVLDSGWFGPVTDFKRKTIYPPKWLKHGSGGRPDYCQTVVGTPFHLDLADSVTIDVLIGDSDPAGGKGRCGYFLFLLKDGKDYGTDAQGVPLLPALQVRPDPQLERKGDVPPFTAKAEDSLLGS